MKSNPVSNSGRTVLKPPPRFVVLSQCCAFGLVLVALWATELLDVPMRVLHTEPSGIDWVGTGVLSLLVILVGAITVSQARAQQRYIMQGFILVCSYCNKAQAETGRWLQLDALVSGQTLAEFTHGMCPECEKGLEVRYGLHDPDDVDESGGALLDASAKRTQCIEPDFS